MAIPKYPKSAQLDAAKYANEPGLVSWSTDAERVVAVGQSSKALVEYGGYSQANSYDSRYNDFSNILPGIHGRPGLTRDGYNHFRPDEAMGGRGHQAVVKRCNTVYKEVGIIRNIVDLMSDFASKGVRISHRDKNTQQFYRNWFKKVKGTERTERFANTAIRTANVVVRRLTGKVDVRYVDKLYKAHAKPDMEPRKEFKLERKELPLQYVFIDAGIVDIVGGSLASFSGQKMFTIRLPADLKRKILSPKDLAEKALVDALPDDIKAAAAHSGDYLLPPDKTCVYYYKKDDWESWATPVLYSVLKDAVAYEKLKLADIAALDGAISHIRIIKLGSVKDKILPTAAAAQRMASILQAHPGGGTLDIVWDDAISIEESKSEIYKYLGSEKYEAVLNAIYGGLGIPPTLTGTGGATGTTNNFISLSTLIERLEYIRGMILEFWQTEIALVHKAMDFRSPLPIVEFDIMNLGNEESMKKLYMDLADRNIVSQETVQRIFKQDDEMEKTRLNREDRERKAGRRPRQNGPFVEPDGTESMKKIALQGGLSAPSQVGLDMPDAKDGEKTLMDHKREQLEMAGQQKIAQQKMVKKAGGQGRPKGTKDATKRKTKTFKPKSRATIEIWATRAQADISDLLTPQILAFYNKKNLRQLTTAEAEQAEKIKFGVLSHIEPLTDINEQAIAQALNAGPIDAEMWMIYSENLKTVATDIQKPASFDDMRRLQVSAYTECYIN